MGYLSFADLHNWHRYLNFFSKIFTGLDTRRFGAPLSPRDSYVSFLGLIPAFTWRGQPIHIDQGQDQ